MDIVNDLRINYREKWGRTLIINYSGGAGGAWTGKTGDKKHKQQKEYLAADSHRRTQTLL
jgi:hypothetical protein